MNSRLTNPKEIPSQSQLANIVGTKLPTIQFSNSAYSRENLDRINALCKTFGASLEVRFYGHLGEAFDASALAHLPNVQWLSIDCLEDIQNVEYLYKLNAIKKLSFGVYNFDGRHLTNQLNINQLEELNLSSTKKNNINLSPLSKASKLHTLAISGHIKGIENLGNSKSIETLRLRSIPKKQNLAFVSNMQNLQSLEISLGGRAEINEITNSEIRTLKLVRIRGLNDLGNLERLPKLENLQIEDQVQLKQFSTLGPPLRTIKILNCKNLENIENLANLESIHHFRLYGTKMDIEELTQFNWPTSLKILALYTGKIKQDKDIRRTLDALGYIDHEAKE